MSVSIIVAMSNNKAIGKDNDLPWKLSNDLKRFKTLTSGKTVIMGRKCYESIGRPLPNRKNVIITRNTEYSAEGCEIRHDLAEAIKEFNIEGEELFIIGGSDIYKESFPIADKLYLTRVLAEVEGDVFLEGLVESDWKLIAFEGNFEENNFKYRFEDYIK